MLQHSSRQKCTKSGLPRLISLSIPFIAAKCHELSSKISDGFFPNLLACDVTEGCARFFWEQVLVMILRGLKITYYDLDLNWFVNSFQAGFDKLFSSYNPA